MKNTSSPQKNMIHKFVCKAPFLWTIPLDLYSDEVERERDRERFLKIQKLKKK